MAGVEGAGEASGDAPAAGDATGDTSAAGEATGATESTASEASGAAASAVGENSAVDGTTATDAMPDDNVPSDATPDSEAPATDGASSGAPAQDGVTTADAAPEANTVPAQQGWYQDANGAWRYINATATEDATTYAYHTGWLVTDVAPGKGSPGYLQRYWLNGDGVLVQSNLIDAGNGWWAYATADGSVVLSKYVLGDKVYLANNDGRLMDTGWQWSSVYAGSNQLYYIDEDTHSAILGYSAKGGEHYTLAEGYVLRGQLRTDGSRIVFPTQTGQGIVETRSTGKYIYYANTGSGILLSAGWHDTGDFSSSSQRYYIEQSTHTAVVGYSANGGHHYTTPEGHVLMGAKQSQGNKVYVAQSDGQLQPTGQWIITDAYTKGTNHRYWIDPTAHAAIIGYSTSGYSHYTLGYGYILGGKMRMGDGMVLTDKHGKLADSQGWLVTSDYDGSSQRYYIDTSSTPNGTPAAKLGYFWVGGKRYYAHYNSGYLFIGTRIMSSYYAAASGGDYNNYHTDTMLITDNTGVILTHEQVGALIVAKTRTQLGRAYSYDDSAAYPNNSFNCSGLSWWVYQDAIGAILSHNQGYYSYYANQRNKENSQAYAVMKRNGWKTNVADLVPGDLVFFSPLGSRYYTGHVGIYVGNGQMIDSYPGRGVTQRSVYQSGFVGGGFPISLV